MNNPALLHFGLTIKTWYMSINKPDWAPPVWAFSVAWGIIYPLIAITFTYVFWQSFVRRTWPLRIGLMFIVNLIANLIYAIGTFTVFNDGQDYHQISTYYWPALIVLLITLFTLAYMIVTAWTRAKWVSIMLVPYLLWICLATSLQFAINFTN